MFDRTPATHKKPLSATELLKVPHLFDLLARSQDLAWEGLRERLLLHPSAQPGGLIPISSPKCLFFQHYHHQAPGFCSSVCLGRQSFSKFAWIYSTTFMRLTETLNQHLSCKSRLIKSSFIVVKITIFPEEVLTRGRLELPLKCWNRKLKMLLVNLSCL